MVKTQPISPAGGVELSDIDITRPLSAEARREVADLFNEHGLLLFRDQPMMKKALVDATHIFGEPDLHPLGNIHDPEIPEVTVISTHGTHGDVIPENEDEIIGRIDWHTDQAYVTNPNRGGVMYSVEIPPEGGMTGFIDMQKTYAALSAEMKRRLEGLSVIQSWRHAQESIARNPSFRTDEGAKMLELDRFPDLACPLVAAHPVTGRKHLHVPPMWSSAIVEMPGQDGDALLAELIRHTLSPKFIYWHSYRPGDVVAWDNWRMIHAASGTEGRYRRIMHRTIIKGGPDLAVPLDPEEKRAADERYARAMAT